MRVSSTNIAAAHQLRLVNKEPVQRITVWEQLAAELVEPLALTGASTTGPLDALTGLFHRSVVSKTLDAHIALNKRCALILIELDAFRSINLRLGHDGGDKLLRQIARALSKVSRSGEVVARVGGDEFAIILPGVARDQQLRLAMIRYRKGLATAFASDADEVQISASIGGAIFPAHASSRAELVEHAELAVREAKAAGGKQAWVFDRRMVNVRDLNARMHSRAAECLHGNNRLITYFQPKVDLSSRAIVGYEALLRCVDHNHVVRSPSWIKAAFDDRSMAQAVGERVRRQTLEFTRGLMCAGNPARVALNLTSWEMQDLDWPTTYLTEAAQLGLAPHLLEVEITESVLLGPAARNSLRTIELLHAAGVTITLDDFGTGYASLTHLCSCPIDGLKIDRSFVSRLSEPTSGAIVQAVIQLGRALSLTVIAEGIETRDQYDALVSAGCEQGQGYLFGEARSAAETMRTLTLPV